MDADDALNAEIEELRSEIARVMEGISEEAIRRREEAALQRLTRNIAEILPRLDAEYPHDPVRLLTDDLTIKVQRGARGDYLWEIGSGANWLSYHVAVTLGLQRLFLQMQHTAVPGLLVYDQPSQVYFPRKLSSVIEMDDLPELSDEDARAVRSVFALLGEYVERAKGRLQVIVLDHAGAEIWGELPGVTLSEEWRGEHKLVPEAWL
jgi:hypothetical protein